jgi:nitroimidazol reductase NimA-like FMN-containing flavoprotein (pyridoxamine 5'-phosphate oxidase superfamily)
MANPNDPATFLPGRKQEQALTTEEAWQVLCSPEVQYGLLGTHGLREEGSFPYVVPMSFGADPQAGALYFHSTDDAASKRCRAIRENAKVSFTAVDPASSIIPDPQGRPCKFTMGYRSVMAFGPIEPVQSPEEKVRLFNFLMQQKAPSARLGKVRPDDVDGAAIWRLQVKNLSGKRSG